MIESFPGYPSDLTDSRTADVLLDWWWRPPLREVFGIFWRMKMEDKINADWKDGRIILASASPRRRELLGELFDRSGLSFEIIPSTAPEVPRGDGVEAVVMNLAEDKARAVARQVAGQELAGLDGSPEMAGVDASQVRVPGPVREDEKRAAVRKPADAGKPVLVIGADTIVVCDEAILGKPADAADAAAMLARLSGRTHRVLTGVALIALDGGAVTNRRVFYESTEVTFIALTAEAIAAYVATGEPMDKAGAYGIQGMGVRFVQEIRGDYDNVVGLPVGRLERELSNFQNA